MDGVLRLLRIFAVLVASAMLAGAACMPVHADRPVGDSPVDLSKNALAWDGIWCLWPRDENKKGEDICWTARVLDAATGLLSLNRNSDRDGAPELVTLHVRAVPGIEGLYFLSEEDTILRGTYLWAIGRPYGTALLVWFTDARRDQFEELVREGQLTGRVTAKTAGRSGFWDIRVDQTLILEGLDESHLKLIIDRRRELFEPFLPAMFMRVGPAEPPAAVSTPKD
ncbi:MAG TPA: hypothetical protein PLE54_17750 [Burkholderiaceae bacterium]|nr:hypothetical protein [Burkholderiaceae bacterium]